MEFERRQRTIANSKLSPEAADAAQGATFDIDRARWREIGEKFANKHDIKTSIVLGYGENDLGDGHDPWGGPCHVVALGYVAPGGPEVLAIGNPIGDDHWYPLVGTSNGYLFGSTFSDENVIVFALATDRLVLPHNPRIPPGTPVFLNGLDSC